MKQNVLCKKAISLALAACLAFGPALSPLPAAQAAETQAELANLTAGYLANPIGIEADAVRFAWNMSSKRIGARQAAYQIQVVSNGQNVWDSGRVEGSQSTGIRCGGSLAEGTEYQWTVTVWDETGASVSKSAAFETGVTNQQAWKDAAFLRLNASPAAPIFRTEQPLEAGKEVAKARLYITALGAYEAYVNGSRVGEYQEDGTLAYHHMNPGYGNGDVSLGYQTYDVTASLAGKQTAAVSAIVGTGWKNGMGNTASQPALKALLAITYTDGSTQNIATNTASWKGTLKGGITSNGIYYGEDYNAIFAEDLGDFTQAGYDASGWADAGGASGNPSMATQIQNRFRPQEASYARLLVKETGPADNNRENLLQIMELELLDAERNNVAAGIAPEISNTWSPNGQWKPQHLTDGDTGTDSDNGYTSEVLGRGQEAFVLDTPISISLPLKQPAVIAGLRIYPRTKVSSISGQQCANYPKAYTVEVSQDGTSWTPVLENYDQGLVRNETLYQNTQLSQAAYPGKIRAQNAIPGKFIPAYDQSPVSAYTYSKTKAFSSYPGGEVEIDQSYEAAPGQNLFGNGLTLKKGQSLIVDMGQNLSAVPQITCSAKQGTRMLLNFAEMLNDGSASGNGATQADGPKGSIYQKSLRGARSAASYIFAGSGQETYQPKMSFFGYQYVQISANDDITIYALRSKAISSVSRQTGKIRTNNETVNKLFSNVLYGQLSNYFTTPTDCNQRDERLSWSGDTQVFAQTAAYNFDSAAFLNEMQEIYNENTWIKGYVPSVIDQINGYFQNWAVGWSDVLIIVPWVMYQQTGDKSILTDNWNAFVHYLDYLHSHERGADQSPASGNQNYGDWLSFQGTSIEVINDYYYGYMHQLMAKIAHIIGNTQKETEYSQKFEAIKRKFLATHVSFVNGNLTIKSKEGNVGLQFMNWTDKKGVWENNSQTSLLWMLKLGFYDSDEMRDAAETLLLENIKNEHPDPGSVRANHGKNTLAGGFLASNVITPTLSDLGHTDVSYDLLLQEGQPSWLFEVLAGATTMWERWNSYTPGVGFGDSEMNSFNHYAYGSVVEWMYRYMAGIQADEEMPGFQHIILQPTPDGGAKYNHQERIRSVESAYESYYGPIHVSWEGNEKTITSYQTQIPANTTATLYLPTEQAMAETAKLPDGVTYEGMEPHNGLTCAKFTLASGGYRFTAGNGSLQVAYGEGYQGKGYPGGNDKPGDDTVKVSSISVKAAKASLFVNEKTTVKATVAPGNATNKGISWKSSNKSVATVDARGTVTAKKAGSAQITATAADGSKVSGRCTIRVVKPTVKLNAKKLKL